MILSNGSRLIKTAALSFVFIFMTMTGVMLFHSTTYAASQKNLKAAKLMYGVSSSHVIKAKTPGKIETALYNAGAKATAKKPYIVYAPAGTYRMSRKLYIPENVIFTAEKGSKFTPTTSNNFTQFFMVGGSLYGGTYDGLGKAYYCLRLDRVKFKDMNGYITNTYVKNSIRAGIVAVGSGSKNGIIMNNTVTGCGNSGISAVEGAWIHTVSGNKCRNNTEAGVNVGHSNIDIIANNILTGNTGHGISTDTDGSGQTYCHIQKIMNNTIKYNGKNGVFMDKNCKVTTFLKNNKIIDNYTNGISIYADGVIKGISGNTIKDNDGSGIRACGKGSAAYVGSNNKITGNAITMLEGGKVIIKGKNNVLP